MNSFIIEKGKLKAYEGDERIVVVPNGVIKIGGVVSSRDEDRPIKGDPGGYKAFFRNETIEELYLPDSVEVFGFKCLEHCKNLTILSFSNNVRDFETNALLGCNSLKKIIFRGTIFEFSLLSPRGHLDLDEVICTDGIIHLHQDYYIDVLYFPGSATEWEQFNKAAWLKKRVRKVVCLDNSNEDSDKELV